MERVGEDGIATTADRGSIKNRNDYRKTHSHSCDDRVAIESNEQRKTDKCLIETPIATLARSSHAHGLAPTKLVSYAGRVRHFPAIHHGDSPTSFDSEPNVWPFLVCSTTTESLARHRRPRFCSFTVKSGCFIYRDQF